MEPITRRSSTVNPNWVTGLIDGEGSFMILFTPNKKLKNGWEVRPSFAASLNKKDRGVLFKLQGYFNCGGVRPCKSDNTYKYEVRSLEDLRKKIIPHFLKYKPLIKIKEFEVFNEVVLLMKEKKHLSESGLRKIVGLAKAINRQENKKNFPRLLMKK